jgi:hypothetical protein
VGIAQISFACVGGPPAAYQDEAFELPYSFDRFLSMQSCIYRVSITCRVCSDINII